MSKQELAKGIYFVGTMDWNMRDFHGYTTPRGVTYNSYLIVDEKICLIDLVKAPFASEFIERIREIVDPADIDYVVINHVEPDHASSLPQIAQVATKAKFLITDKGQQEADKMYGVSVDYQTVKLGDTINLGKNNLTFVPLPMLHWPDSMVCYCPEQKILFSSDAFGQHICTSKRLDCEVDVNEVLYEAEKYFANILMPYARLIPNALKTLATLEIDYIMPAHGVIWHKHIDEILAKYAAWGAQAKEARVVIVYDSMWGATECMARALLEGVVRAGVTANFYRISVSEESHIVHDILGAGGVLVGSPTLNYGMMPSTAALLYYLKGLKPQGKLAAAFGAYGWSGGSQKDIEEFLTKAGMQVQAGVTVAWKGDAQEIAACEQYGYEFALKVKETFK